MRSCLAVRRGGGLGVRSATGEAGEWWAVFPWALPLPLAPLRPLALTGATCFDAPFAFIPLDLIPLAFAPLAWAECVLICVEWDLALRERSGDFNPFFDLCD